MSKLEIKAIPRKEIYYKEDFGIYNCEVQSIVSNLDKQVIDEFIVIKGNTPKLIIGEEYNIAIKQVEDLRYGYQYEIICVREEVLLNAVFWKDYLHQIRLRICMKRCLIHMKH